MSERVEAFIGLGANMGDARAGLERAVAGLAAMPDVDVVAVSALYRTAPVGLVEQPDFLNAVARLHVPRGPSPETGAMALLVALKQLERALGRRERARWGPREMDLDLLLFGPYAIHLERDPDARSEDPARGGAQWLDVPHAAARERLFVLAPLSDLAPRLVPPGWGMTVAETAAAAQARERPGAVVRIAAWDASAGRWRDEQAPG